MQDILVDITRNYQRSYEKDITLQEISRDFQSDHRTMIVAAKVNNVVKDLQTKVDRHVKIEFIDMESETGAEVYRRSVEFLLIVAAHELYPDIKIVVENSLENGLFCRIIAKKKFTADDVIRLEEKMRAIVAENRPIEKMVMKKEDAEKLFLKQLNKEKADLIKSLNRKTVSIYCCGGYYDYLYGAKVPNTGVLDKFALDFRYGGIIVRTPSEIKADCPCERREQPKLSNAFKEAASWADILNCDYVPMLNEHIKNGRAGDLIRLSEALHEKQFVKIATEITENIDRLKLVNGINPLTISLDDYFVDRENTPRGRDGAYNFEAIEALDLKLFNEQLVTLLDGGEVELPRYNFVTGRREPSGRVIKRLPHQPIIIEGIHGLNERLTSAIPRESKYKIYISALTQLAIDEHNRISTTQSRLIRRIVRDNQFRGTDAKSTIRRWASVRAGEDENIFPYQEDADVMFNSALIYELAVLKKYAEPLLKEVSPELPEYTMTVRLMDFLEYFTVLENEADIPNNSIIREFIGGSCFFE
jgi:uridine kinase